MNEVIATDAVPALPADPTALVSAADEMKAQAVIVKERTSDATKRWSTLTTVFDGMHPVTDHAALVPEGEGWGYLDSGTESLQNIGRAIVGRTGELTRALPEEMYDPKETPWTD